MPGVFQMSVDHIVRECNEVHALGIPGVIFFGIPERKDDLGSEAYDDQGVIQQALRAVKKEVPEDLYNLMKQAVSLHRHLAENKKDNKAKHGLELMESKIRRLSKYYVRTGKVPKDWKYSIERARLIVG